MIFIFVSEFFIFYTKMATKQSVLTMATRRVFNNRKKKKKTYKIKLITNRKLHEDDYTKRKNEYKRKQQIQKYRKSYNNETSTPLTSSCEDSDYANTKSETENLEQADEK